MGQVNTRELALMILQSVTEEQAFVNQEVHRVLEKYRYLPKQERAFLTRLAEGTVERIPELDHILDQFSKTPVRKMKPLIRNILRCGVYQLKYMDAVPDRAACSEAVKLAVSHGFGGLRGFVNGVLRNIARSLDDIRWPDEKTDRAGYLSVRYSMPRWLTERFLAQYGAGQCEAILKGFLEERGTWIRTETSQITPEELEERLTGRGITVRRGTEPAYAMEISGYEAVSDIPEFREGLFYVQDPASMMAAELAAPRKDSFVLDVCAAPGGKSFHIASLMEGTGRIEARDLTEEKVGLIRENMERFPFAPVHAKVWDARVFDPEMEEKCDLVIADLPCSGLGVIGRKPDIKYHVTEDSIRQLAALQREILSVVRRYVKPGGVLMYSTCTLADEENRQNTEWFLRENPDYSKTAELELLPGRERDGFYIARLERNGTNRS